MKKITILTLLVLFVFSVNAQFLPRTNGQLGTKLDKNDFLKHKNQKDAEIGWFYPIDIGVNMHAGSYDFFTAYLQPFWQDSAVTYIYSSGNSNPWVHSLAQTFDARSLAYSEFLDEQYVCDDCPYAVDAISLPIWYLYQNGTPDTLRFEIIDINVDNTTYYTPLVYNSYPDYSLPCMNTQNISTAQMGLGVKLLDPSAQVFDVVLDGTYACNPDSIGYFSASKDVTIELSTPIIIQPGHVLGVNCTYISGATYSPFTVVYDVTGNTTHTDLNPIFFPFYSQNDELDENGFFEFYDSFGYNMFQIAMTYERYQNTSSLLKDVMYPMSDGATYFAFHVNEVIGISENNINATIYPNPATDLINVNLSQSGNAVITLTNILGQTVKTINTNEITNSISTNDLAKGMYIVKIEQNGGVATKKVVVE